MASADADAAMMAYLHLPHLPSAFRAVTQGVRAGCHAAHRASFAVTARPCGKPPGSGCSSLTQGQACRRRQRRRRPFPRRGLRLLHPGRPRRAVRRPAVTLAAHRRGSGKPSPCLSCLSPFQPFHRGQSPPQPVPGIQATQALAKNFLPKSRQKLFRQARTPAPCRGVTAPAAAVLKRVKISRASRSGAFPQNVNTATTVTQRVMIF